MKPDVAFYYPGQYWWHSDSIKDLILFFDGLAFLIPEYMSDYGSFDDYPVIKSLRDHGLFHVIRPEEQIGPSETEKLAVALVEIITSGRLDHLVRPSKDSASPSHFGSLSMSRLGYYGDPKLADFIVAELKERGLAAESQDGVSIPMHQTVRSLILVLLAQILKGKGVDMGITLSPTTDRPQVVKALGEIVSGLNSEPSSASVGQIVTFDMATVGVDLSSVPIQEVLDFREQNYSLHRDYRLAVRRFARELSQMPEDERNASFEQRQEELNEIAEAIRSMSLKAWRTRASFGLTISGIGLTAGEHPIGPVLSIVGALLGLSSAKERESGVYSYLFSAQRSLP